MLAKLKGLVIHILIFVFYWTPRNSRISKDSQRVYRSYFRRTLRSYVLPVFFAYVCFCVIISFMTLVPILAGGIRTVRLVIAPIIFLITGTIHLVYILLSWKKKSFLLSRVHSVTVVSLLCITLGMAQTDISFFNDHKTEPYLITLVVSGLAASLFVATIYFQSSLILSLSFSILLCLFKIFHIATVARDVTTIEVSI